MLTREIVQPTISIISRIVQVAVRLNKDGRRVRPRPAPGTRVLLPPQDNAGVDGTGPDPVSVTPRPLADHDCVARAVRHIAQAGAAVPVENTQPDTLANLQVLCKSRRVRLFR